MIWKLKAFYGSNILIDLSIIIIIRGSIQGGWQFLMC